MNNNIEMDRRKFLVKFAKLSTATIVVGFSCVACPAPGPEDSIGYSIIDIDGEKQHKSSKLSNNLSTIYIVNSNPSLYLELFKITIKDEENNTNISLIQDKIDDKTLKITIVDNQLSYGSSYSLDINYSRNHSNADYYNNFSFDFDTTPIQLSKEKLSLALDRQEEITVEGLYVNNEMVSDFKILSVEKERYSDYGDGQNGEVIATIENEIITIKGTKQGKVMLEIVVADKVDEDGESSFYKAYLFVEVV